MHPNDTTPDPNPSGLCMCGCGQPTNVIPVTQRARGYVRGHHFRFVMGHNTRRSDSDLYTVEDRGFDTPCWVWSGSLDKKGYGRINRDGYLYAHRYMYERVNGPVPEGFELDHLCRVRQCVNPGHVEPVTHAENMRRSVWQRLSPDELETIISLDGKMPQVRIAERFGVSQAHISRILIAARREAA